MKHECKVHKTGMGLKPRTLTPVGLQSWLIVLLLEVQAGVVSCCPTPCTRQFQGYTKDIQCEDFCKISAPCYILVCVFLDFCWGRASSLRHIRTGDSNIPESGHWAFRPSFKSSIEKEEKWWSWIVLSCLEAAFIAIRNFAKVLLG